MEESPEWRTLFLFSSQKLNLKVVQTKDNSLIISSFITYPVLPISYLDWYWPPPDIIKNFWRPDGGSIYTVFTLIYSFLYLLELAVSITGVWVLYRCYNYLDFPSVSINPPPLTLFHLVFNLREQRFVAGILFEVETFFAAIFALWDEVTCPVFSVSMK